MLVRASGEQEAAQHQPWRYEAIRSKDVEGSGEERKKRGRKRRRSNGAAWPSTVSRPAEQSARQIASNQPVTKTFLMLEFCPHRLPPRAG